MHMFYGPGGYLGWGWGGMIISILFWLAVIGSLIYFVFRLATRRNNNNVNGPPAMEVLKKRYAAGEITKEQFLSIKEDLKERPPKPEE